MFCDLDNPFIKKERERVCIARNKIYYNYRFKKSNEKVTNRYFLSNGNCN